MQGPSPLDGGDGAGKGGQDEDKKSTISQRLKETICGCCRQWVGSHEASVSKPNSRCRAVPRAQSHMQTVTVTELQTHARCHTHATHSTAHAVTHSSFGTRTRARAHSCTCAHANCSTESIASIASPWPLALHQER
eukprot:7281439-Alexandrium_andersonii.AAC.1